MEEHYTKESQIQELSNLDKKNELKESIKKSKIILMNMHNNLKFAEGELIDYYIYQIKAEEAKYDYLIKKAKEIF